MNRWFFWVLAPVMLATAFGLPFLVEPPIGGFIAFAIPSIVFLLTGRSGSEVDVLISDEPTETPNVPGP